VPLIDRIQRKGAKTQRRKVVRLALVASLHLCAFALNLLFYLITPAVAQEAEKPSAATAQPPPDAGPSSPWQWTFTLRNRTGYRLDEPRVLQMSRTLLDVKGSYKINDRWNLTLEGRAHVDPVGRLGYADGVWLDPRQVIVDGKIKNVDVRLGLQQIVWGEADGLRVLDVINPLDYREFILEDFLDSRRPLWAARIDVPAAGGSLQVIWVPHFASARLPAPNNEFGLGASFGVGLINSALGSSLPPFNRRVLPNERPAYQLKSSQAGARYRRSVGGWDVTANYFYGWEEIPTSYVDRIETRPGDQVPTIVLRPRFDRKEILGGTGTTNFGPIVLRMEAGWSRDKSIPVRSGTTSAGFRTAGQFSGVIGLDYSPRAWVWLSSQYFLQFTSAPQSALIFPRYDHLMSFYARTNFFREKLKPELFVLSGLSRKQYMVRPRIVRTFGDHFSLGGGADFLGGSPATIFGYFDNRDRAVLELKWMW
jgi:hypothetical protein